MEQGAKKIIFIYSLPFGQAEDTCSIYQPRHHFNQPQKLFDQPSRIDFTVLLLFEFLKKHHLPVGQVKNRIHQPDSKIHQPWTIRHQFLCTLWRKQHIPLDHFHLRHQIDCHPNKERKTFCFHGITHQLSKREIKSINKGLFFLPSSPCHHNPCSMQHST